MCLLFTLYEPTWPVSRTFSVTALELNNWGQAKYKTAQLLDNLVIHIINQTTKFQVKKKNPKVEFITWQCLKIHKILGVTGQIIVADIIITSAKGDNLLYYVT